MKVGFHGSVLKCYLVMWVGENDVQNHHLLFVMADPVVFVLLGNHVQGVLLRWTSVDRRVCTPGASLWLRLFGHFWVVQWFIVSPEYRLASILVACW